MNPDYRPDTQTILAGSIVVLMFILVGTLLYRPPALDERMLGVLLTITGVLLATFKDVFGFYFGSSAGSKAKDEAQTKMVQTLTGTGPGNGQAAINAKAAFAEPRMMAVVAKQAAEAAAPAAAAQAAPAAAAVVAPAAAEAAAPPAADIAAPPAAEKAVAEALEKRNPTP